MKVNNNLNFISCLIQNGVHVHVHVEEDQGGNILLVDQITDLIVNVSIRIATKWIALRVSRGGANESLINF